MAQQKVYVVIHGHFYQPPRENPWLGIIERQPSAYPYHDWNEKIAAACYTPNTVSRILNGNGRIDHIINNFAQLSFNVGPTLMQWMRRRLGRTAERIVEADKLSVHLRGGHGNAIAQVYNHVIMPLATPTEKDLQVYWGIRDFRQHFGRDPEGMWLAETACNYATLEVLVKHGIKFTILAPDQAFRVRPIRKGGKPAPWVDVSDGSIDTTRPYRIFMVSSEGEKLPHRYIDVFFFDRPLSTEMSFSHLLTNADQFGQHLLRAVRPDRPNQLINVATDGETFGWHEPFADMCLAYFFEHTAKQIQIEFTNYPRYLEMFHPEYEVQLKAGGEGLGTSWSCVHGVDRWRENCGCSTDSPAWWQQKWRKPLREAFDLLRDRVEKIYQDRLADWCTDLGAMRREYIDVILDRREEVVNAFFGRHLKPDAPSEVRTTALALLESLHNSLLSFSSCAWFFGEVSRLEPVQSMKYALRAIQLASPYTGEDLSRLVTDKLKEARSNIPELGDGKKIFHNLVEPAYYSMEKVVSSYAICLLTVGRANLPVYNYRVAELDSRSIPDKYPSQVGLLRLQCRVMLCEKLYAFHVTRFTVKDVRCYVKEMQDRQEYERLLESLEGSEKSNLPAIFGSNYLSWHDMIPEVGGELMRTLFDEKLSGLREQFDHMFDDNKDLFDAYVAAGLELPYEVKGLVSLSLSRAFTDVIIKHRGDWERVSYGRAVEIQNMARNYGVKLDVREVEPLINEDLLAESMALKEDLSAHRLANIFKILDIGLLLGFTLRRDLAENIILEVLEEQVIPRIDALADSEKDFESYRSVLGILDWMEKLNFSKRRFEERLQPFETRLAAPTARS